MSHRMLALAALVALLGWPACDDGGGDGDADTDTDVDVDTDADTDTDTDADGDADADTDTDTDADSEADGDSDGDADGDADGDTDGDADAEADAETDADEDLCGAIHTGCCSGTCHCTEGDCVQRNGIGPPGVCKTPDLGGGCWQDSDCGFAEVCQGANVCPCGASCYVADSPGTCVPSERCAGSGGPPYCIGDACPEGYFCMELGADDTCHAVVTFPSCWTDDDCDGGLCSGADICNCGVFCLSTPGICSFLGD